MEQKIMEVMRRMQDMLSEEQLRELQSALRVTFDGCELQPRSELMVLDDSWQGDLEDFLMSKALEGKSKATIIRYRYELERLLSYINKAVVRYYRRRYIEIICGAYKSIREMQNSTLKGVRCRYTVASSCGCVIDDRIRKNPMVLVEVNQGGESASERPFTDTEREQLA